MAAGNTCGVTPVPYPYAYKMVLMYNSHSSNDLPYNTQFAHKFLFHLSLNNDAIRIRKLQPQENM